MSDEEITSYTTDEDASQKSNQRDEEEIVPKQHIRSNVLKSALKTFVLQHVNKYYETAAIRCMIKEKDELWLVRQQVEAALKNDQHVIGMLVLNFLNHYCLYHFILFLVSCFYIL